MKIKNLLDKDLNLLFKGENYVLEAGVTKEFTPEVVAQWINIYGFLAISSGSSKEIDAVVEAVEEIKKEEKEEAKPKKKVAKKTK